jgi:glutaredoxin
MLPFIILGAVNTYIFLNTGKKETGTWTVYGTTWCGWTTKQLEYLKKKSIDHKFVDCEKGKCDGIDAFPVIESPNGERITGYKEI